MPKKGRTTKDNGDGGECERQGKIAKPSAGTDRRNSTKTTRRTTRTRQAEAEASMEPIWFRIVAIDTAVSCWFALSGNNQEKYAFVDAPVVVGVVSSVSVSSSLSSWVKLMGRQRKTHIGSMRVCEGVCVLGWLVCVCVCVYVRNLRGV